VIELVFWEKSLEKDKETQNAHNYWAAAGGGGRGSQWEECLLPIAL
jgi:hypothetical protein